MRTVAWIIAVCFAVVVVVDWRASAYVIGAHGCLPYDPDVTEPATSDRVDKVRFQINRTIWNELQGLYNASPEKRYHIEIALDLIRQCSIRRLEEGSISDLEEFRARCKKPFTRAEARYLQDEFEAQFIIVQALRKMLNDEVADPNDELQDFRTRQLRYGLRIHEAIARSMELLPLPLKLVPRVEYLSFLVVFLLITLLIVLALVGALISLIEREPQRIQEGMLQLHRLWNRAKVTVFQAEWDKNKVSISTFPPLKAEQGLAK